MFNRSTLARPRTILILAAVVLFLILIASGGIGGILLMLGIVVLLTALFALLTKRRTFLRLPHRKSAGIVAGAGIVALIAGTGVIGATAAPSAPNVNKSELVASQPATPTVTPTPTPTETNPAGDTCYTAAESREYRGWTYVCTENTDKRLVWMSEAASLRVQKEVAAKKAAEEAVAKKLAAKKLAAEKAAAKKLVEQKAAAKKAAEEKKAEAKRLADLQAAEQAAAEEAARQAALAPAPYVPPAPGGGAVSGYVHPGSFCSGGTGVSKTGRAMVCAPASDGRMRWIGA